MTNFENENYREIGLFKPIIMYGVLILIGMLFYSCVDKNTEHLQDDNWQLHKEVGELKQALEDEKQAIMDLSISYQMQTDSIIKLIKTR